MSGEPQTLYRPVGVQELVLIMEADAKAFPPRLPEQPIFYPVLNFEYAAQIARQWNTQDERSGFAGFVTAFEVDHAYCAQFKEHVVGAAMHRELWIPAAELDNFNQHIRGQIVIQVAYLGAQYQSDVVQVWQQKFPEMPAFSSENLH